MVDALTLYLPGIQLSSSLMTGWWKGTDRHGATLYVLFHPSGDGRWVLGGLPSRYWLPPELSPDGIMQWCRVEDEAFAARLSMQAVPTEDLPSDVTAKLMALHRGGTDG